MVLPKVLPAPSFSSVGTALVDVVAEQYAKLVERDLALLWQIQDYIYRHPQLDSRLASMVSKHPWRDVCMVIWLFAGLGVYFDVGIHQQHHFWMITFNLLASFVARKLLRAKRPVEYDERLQPMTDLAAESFGFPSLEAYMSVVIMGHFTLHTSLPLMLLPSLVVVFLIGFSRVYTRARFPHQIVGSWVLGLFGLSMGYDCCRRLEYHRLNAHQQWTCLVIVCVVVAINFGLAMENNDSRLVYVPRKEFLRVLVDIVNGGSSEPGARREDEPGDDVDGADDNDAAFQDARPPLSSSSQQRPLQSPRAAALQRAKLSGPSNRGYNGGKHPKRDSFFFLQRSLEERERKISTGTTRNPLSLASPRSDAGGGVGESVA